MRITQFFLATSTMNIDDVDPNPVGNVLNFTPMQFSNLGSSKMEISETDFSDILTNHYFIQETHPLMSFWSGPP